MVSKKRHQKMYKMRGCFKTRKHFGGNLANSSSGGTGSTIFLYPNKGPPPAENGQTIFNSTSSYKGGCGGTCPLTNPQMGGKGCGCNLSNLLSGGNAGGLMIGGTMHRKGCKCRECKNKQSQSQKGGSNALIGSSWTSNALSWPGVNGIGGDGNHYANIGGVINNDPTRQMIDTNLNKPFKGGNGKRKQRGGVLSNFMGQDLINLGRQFQFGVGSAYNALAGYQSPVNPLPWQGQFSKNM